MIPLYKTVEEFRDAVQAHFPLKNVIYQPILHPLFEGWTTSRPCPETLELMLETLGDVKGKHVLDLGCALGYYSHRLVEMGAFADGVELKEDRYVFCLYLSELYGLPSYNPMFYSMDITDFVLNRYLRHYDAVIFLNTIHWVYRKHKHRTWDVLNKISTHCDKMYLSRGGKIFTPDKVVENTHFTTCTDLGFPSKKGRGRRRRIYLYE